MLPPNINLPLSHDSLLFVRQGIPPEGEHHQPGAIDQHHSTAVLGVHSHNRDVYILDKSVLNVQNKKNKENESVLTLSAPVQGGA